MFAVWGPDRIWLYNDGRERSIAFTLPSHQVLVDAWQRINPMLEVYLGQPSVWKT
jgi:hypothetical protein